MSALWLVLICLGAGVVVARLKHPEGLSLSLNWWMLYIALPALVLDQITRLAWSPSMLFPAAAMWGVFLGAWALIALVGRWRGWTRGQIGALVLTCGLGNTAFVGYPLVEALRGTDSLGTAVIADQLGSFLVLSSLGVIVAALYAGQHIAPRQLAKRVLLFPAFIALMAAFALRGLGGLPAPLAEVAARLGSTLTPLALFSVGMQLKLKMPGNEAEPMAWGLSWKLLLAPLLIWGLASSLNITGEALSIAVLQGAMAPMITAGILAQQHGLAPGLASRIVGIGIVLSLITVPLFHHVLP